MADFDPDAYLEERAGPSEDQSSGAFDPDKYIADFDPDAYLKNAAKPESEGFLARATRNIAHGVLPAVGGYAGAGAGAEAGATLGAMTGNPIVAGAGAIIGGVAGAFGGGTLAEKAQEKVQDAIPSLDDREQLQANIEAHPVESMVEGAVPAFAGMRFDKGATMLARGVSAGMQGGIQAAQDYANEGSIDPGKAAAIAALGAVFPSTNRVGETVMGAGKRIVPGRPGRTANPAADASHADVGDQSVETAVGDSVLAETPPRPQGATTGNPQSAPGRSPRVYKKTTDVAEQARYREALSDPEAMREFAHEEGLTEAEAREIAQANYEGDEPQVTTGHMDPATAAALKAAQPQPVPAPKPPRQRRQPRPLTEQPGEGPNGKLGQPQQPQPAVEAGFPQPGEPVAVGENEATPLPEGQAQRGAAAAQSTDPLAGLFDEKAAPPPPPSRPKPAGPPTTDLSLTPETMRKLSLAGKTKQEIMSMSPAEAEKVLAGAPDPMAGLFNVEEPKPIKGETAKGASLTDGHKEAGNFKKGRSGVEFGKNTAWETRAGDVRRSKSDAPEPWEVKSPYDYGYFNKTKSTDGEGIDRAQPPKGSPESGEKHFIIDQKDATTGKYDEPKVFTYVKDEAAARDLYNRGFSDNKGPDRLHDITEVSKEDLSKYLLKHTKTGPKAPYGKAIPARPPKVIKTGEDLPAKLGEAEGRAREYGVSTGKSAGYPVEGRFTAEGTPVTANTKTKAEALSKEHKAIVDWFEKSAPTKKGETTGDVLDRIKGAPELRRGVQNIPKEWMLAKAARETLKKPTPANVEKFKKAEMELRGGGEADYRHGNRIEADAALSHRSGDAALAEAEKAAAPSGINTEEDAVIEGLDRARQRAGKFGTVKPVKTKADLKEPPKKAIDVRESALMEKPRLRELTPEEKARKAEARALLGREVAKPKTETPKAKPISVADADPKYIQKLIEMSNKASKRKGLSEDAIQTYNTTADMPLFNKFLGDESGAVNFKGIPRINLTKSPVKSYIARTPKANEPHADYTRNLDEDLHKVSQADKSHRLNLRDQVYEAAKAVGKDFRPMMERIYTAREADSAQLPQVGGKTHIDNLSPADKAIYDKYLKPVFDENDAYYDAMVAAGHGDRLGPKVENHIARITKGDTSEYNMLKDRSDPTGPDYNGLSVNATMAHERPFVALERVSDGKRFLIQNRPEGGFTLWDKYKGQRIKDPSYSFEANQPYTVTDKAGNKADFIMRHATSAEIEANARGRDGKGKPMKYYKNAALSAYMTNAQMGSMARHLGELARISSTPEWKDLTTTNPATASEKGWKESKLPNFKGTYMDPQLRYVVDDYAKPGFDSPQIIRDFNSSVTKLLFWMPTAHIANVGVHWFVGRGFDNLNVKALYETGAKAIKSVMTQDAYQKALRDHGAGTILPSVLTRRFIEQMAKATGEEFVRDPSKWGPIADKIGVPLKKLGDAIYDNSSKVMWAVNDMFLTQRVMELERKGHSMADAIKIAEKDIPNYRVPSTLINSGPTGRIMSQLMTDPTLIAFGRYHYGMFNSYANIIKDAVGKDRTVGDRVDAAGKMMALGLVAYGIYPVLDKLWQLTTGNEDAKANRRGPTAIPSHLKAAMQGKEDIMSAARSTFTLQPAITTLLETLSNKDFRGKNIVEPGDVRAAAGGNVKAGGRALLQEGEHAARGLVSPYSTFATATSKFKTDNPGVAAAKAVRDQALDIKNPSPASVNYERKVPINTFKDANSRFRKGGNGPAEAAYDKIFGR